MSGDTRRRAGARPGTLALGLALFAAALSPQRASAQASWEYRPYDVRVWLATERAPQLAGLIEELDESLPSRSRAVVGGAWELRVVPPPAALGPLLLDSLPEVAVAQIERGAQRAALEADKLFLAVVTAAGGGYHVAVRELDCRSRQLGHVLKRDCPTRAMLAVTVWDLLTLGFTPLARIEQVDGPHVVARLRAGGLATSGDSPVLAEPGMVLRPVVRRNDRSGQPARGGIQPIGWTFLTVDERREAVLECSLVSGFRAALPPRGGPRLERLALVVRPHDETTQLVLRSRTDPGKPLAGYEVYQRGTGPDEATLLGTTGADGSLLLPSDAGSLTTLIVKNGQQLLARLPVVIGQAATLTAAIVDDDARLAAEGYIAALSSRAMDLVARREILAARIRLRLKEGKLDEARRLLDEFRRLETRAELSRDLDRFRQQLTASDKLTQARIDRLFTDAQRFLLIRPLGDDLLNQLTREVSAPPSNTTQAVAGKQTPD